METIKDIVARVAATDRQGQDRFIDVQGNTIAINSPLSIKRIVAVSASRANAPPAKAGATGFPVAERIDLTSRMQRSDTRGAWAEERIAGLATHFLLHPALPPGHYEVPFDREPAGVFLLFQTDAALRLGLRDAAGGTIQPQNGVHRIARGAEATLVLEVVDRAGDRIVTVPVSQLGDGTTFRAGLDLAGQRTDLDARAAPAAEVATAALPTGTAGRGKVDASMRVEGFVSTFAQPLELEILDIEGAVTLRLEGVEACATCAADEVRYTIVGSQPPRPIAKLVVETTAPLDGTLALKLADAPPWLSLADAAGAPLAGAPVKANEPLRIEAFVFAAADATALAEASAGGLQFGVQADLVGGPQGSAQATARIQLVPGEASLRLTGHSQDPTGAAPLTLGVDDAAGGERGAGPAPGRRARRRRSGDRHGHRRHAFRRLRAEGGGRADRAAADDQCVVRLLRLPRSRRARRARRLGRAGRAAKRRGRRHGRGERPLARAALALRQASPPAAARHLSRLVGDRLAEGAALPAAERRLRLFRAARGPALSPSAALGLDAVPRAARAFRRHPPRGAPRRGAGAQGGRQRRRHSDGPERLGVPHRDPEPHDRGMPRRKPEDGHLQAQLERHGRAPRQRPPPPDLLRRPEDQAS